MKNEDRLSPKDLQNEFRNIIAEMERRGIIPRIRYELAAIQKIKDNDSRHITK